MLGDAPPDAGHGSGDALLTAWYGEPGVRDEAYFTRWAEAGWRSWNGMSPELEICQFVVSLVRALRPQRLVETGVGQGFLTRRVEEALNEPQRFTCFESDGTWRAALASLTFFNSSVCTLSARESPSDEELRTADLCILDSDFPYRLVEIERWWRVAPEGAVLFVHDAGNGHGPETPHALVRAKIRELAIPGFFLSNPRGAFVGVTPSGRDHPPASGRMALERRLDAAEGELLALRTSRTFRYSAPLRWAYARIRGVGRR